MSGRHAFLFLLSRLQAELNRLFTEFEGLGEAMDDEAAWTPTVDVIESETTLVLIASVPGLRAADLELEISGDVVTLTGTRRTLADDDETRVLQQTRQAGTFRRRIQLPRPVNGSRAAARLADGLLEISFPKIVDQRQTSRVISIGEDEG